MWAALLDAWYGFGMLVVLAVVLWWTLHNLFRSVDSFFHWDDDRPPRGEPVHKPRKDI